MAETISQFLKSIEDERKKGLAQKAQALMPYLNQMYQQSRQEEETEKQRGIALEDTINMAKAAGYQDQDIDAWMQSASSLRDPNAIRNSWSDHENRIAATGLLKKYGGDIPEGATTNELMMLAKERMEEHKRGKEIDNTIQQTTGEGDPNDPDVRLYQAKRGVADRDETEGIEKKAKLLGTAGYKVYQGLVNKGSDPYEAYGEVFILQSIKPRVETCIRGRLRFEGVCLDVAHQHCYALRPALGHGHGAFNDAVRNVLRDVPLGDLSIDLNQDGIIIYGGG